MAVPAIDPGSQKGRLLERLGRFARTPAGQGFLKAVSTRVDPVLLRLSGGRISTVPTAPVVLLTVPGRRSGTPRRTPLLYFTDGDDVILVASNFGRPGHPAWYRNVMAHPEVMLEARGRSGRYVAREVTGPERDRLFALARQLYAGYGDYELSAGGAGRTIPVLALRPA